MEILNNIWTLLTTSNVLNVQLIAMPFTFIEAYITISFFLLIINVSASKKSKILYVIIQSLIGIIINFFIPNPFNVFMNYISLFVLIIMIFKTNIFKALISLVVSVAIFRNHFFLSSQCLYYNF